MPQVLMRAIARSTGHRTWSTLSLCSSSDSARRVPGGCFDRGVETATHVAFIGDNILRLKAVEDFVGIECFYVMAASFQGGRDPLEGAGRLCDDPDIDPAAVVRLRKDPSHSSSPSRAGARRRSAVERPWVLAPGSDVPVEGSRPGDR